jgi:hypothetical protein
MRSTPYYQLSYSIYEKTISEFVKKGNVDRVKKQIENYKMFMKLKNQ